MLPFQGGETTISHVLLLARIVGDKDMTLGFGLFQHHVPQHSFCFPGLPNPRYVGRRNCSKFLLVQEHAILGVEFRLHVEVEYPKVDDCCSACESFHCNSFVAAPTLWDWIPGLLGRGIRGEDPGKNFLYLLHKSKEEHPFVHRERYILCSGLHPIAQPDPPFTLEYSFADGYILAQFHLSFCCCSQKGENQLILLFLGVWVKDTSFRSLYIVLLVSG